MIKDFSRLFQKGNLTPKERVLLLIANTLNQTRGEKGFLSEADIYALCEGWTPNNNDEVAEYNRYNQGWKYSCFAEMDAQTHYLQAKVAYQTMQIMLKDFSYYPIYSEVKQALDGLNKIKRVEAKEAIEIINKQKQEKLKQGNSIDGVIKDLAFEIMGEETRKKLTELYDDIDLEDFLDEIEELLNLYEKKDFGTIAKRVSSKCYNDYTKEYQLFHNYAGIQIKEIAERYAKENNLPFIEETDEEKQLKAIEELAKTLEQHAKDKQTTIEEIIKQTCLKWIGEGLLENGDTAITQEERELIPKWTENKLKAKEVLQGLIDKGELKTDKAEDGTELITGDSLYNSKLNYVFIKDFKSWVDEYCPEMGLVNGDDGEHLDQELLITKEDFFSRYKTHLTRATVYLEALSILQEKEENGEIVLDIEKEDIKTVFLKLRNDFINKYQILLAFEDLFKRISKVYEMDLTCKIDLWITECKELISSFNDKLLDALKITQPFSLQENKQKHYKDDRFFIDTEKIKPADIAVELYYKEMTKVLGDDF